MEEYVAQHPKLAAQREAVAALEAEMADVVNALMEATEPVEVYPQVKNLERCTKELIAAVRAELLLRAQHEKFMRVEEIADGLGVSEQNIYNLISRGKPKKSTGAQSE